MKMIEVCGENAKYWSKWKGDQPQKFEKANENKKK